MLMQADVGKPLSAHVIVLGNEKGGSGKSTTAMHVAVALLHAGQRVATIDLDETLQRTNSGAIGGTADMPRSRRARRSDAFDPQQTSDVQCNRLAGCRIVGVPGD